MPRDTKSLSCESLISSQVLYRWIQKVYVMLDDFDRRILLKFGLNTSQYRTLLMLDDEKGERLTAISERLLLSKSTITRVVDELEERGWVQRIPDPDDRRAQRVVLTETGVEMQREICTTHRQALDEIFQTLSEQEQAALDGFLSNLFDRLQVTLDNNGLSMLEE